jgi:hypothetical protein
MSVILSKTRNQSTGKLVQYLFFSFVTLYFVCVCTIFAKHLRVYSELVFMYVMTFLDPMIKDHWHVQCTWQWSWVNQENNLHVSDPEKNKKTIYMSVILSKTRKMFFLFYSGSLTCKLFSSFTQDHWHVNCFLVLLRIKWSWVKQENNKHVSDPEKSRKQFTCQWSWVKQEENLHVSDPE